MKTLTQAESTEHCFPLSGLSLYCGFYVNELVLGLLAKEVNQADVFIAYRQVILQLVQNINQAQTELALRVFEYALLSDLGLGFDLNFDVCGHQIQPEKKYTFADGFKLSENQYGVSGGALVYLTGGNHPVISADYLAQLRRLMKMKIEQALAGKKLKSRVLLQDYLRVKRHGK